MKLHYSKTFFKFIFVFALCFSEFISGQTIIESQPFISGSLPPNWTQTSVTFSTSSGGYANFTATNSVLTSPVYDLSNYINVTLSMSVAKFGTGTDGPITVEISNDGGSTWTAQTFNSGTPTDSNYVNTTNQPVTVTGTNVRIRFTRINSPSQKRFRNFVLQGELAPVAPTITTLLASTIGLTNATLNGSINANNLTTTVTFEYGTTTSYGSTVSATPSTVTGTTATSISASISSLSLNTLYHYRAVGTVSGTPTNGSDMTFYTLAATPGVLTISNSFQTTLDVTLNATTENGNPSITEYAIQETGGQYVQANGTLGASAVWQTASTWATTTVSGLSTSTTYTFQAKARNGSNVETVFGATANGTTLAAQLVDYAVVQFPNTTQSILENTDLTVYVRSYEPALTDLSGEQSNLFAWVGYSSTNVDPSNPVFTWIPATFNAEFGNDDEYQATLTGLPIGTYYYAARFQIGTGPYVYGGSNGNWNNDNVTLNVNADVVDYANIQFPTTATITEGNTVTVYAQVYELGVTEAAGQGTGITAEIGYSSTDSTPDATWTWVPATFNIQSGNNDEYQATIGSSLAPGTYYYASRFLKSGSSTYVYGGTSGVWSAGNSGVLTVNVLGSPNATAATVVTPSSFTANWDAVTDATGYRLDVSTSPIFTGETISLAEWTFPTDGTIVTPDVSTANNTTKMLTTNGGTISSSAGDVTESASANQWQSGNGNKYWQIDFDATGYYNINLSSAQRSSNTGPKNFKVQYKLGAGSWTDTGTDVVVANNFTTGITNLTLPSLCDNQSEVSVRWIMTSNVSVGNGTVASGGTSRIDEIIVSSTTNGFIQPYENLDVGNVTSYNVTGLTQGTTYYYRVRAVGQTTSGNGNVIDVTTGYSSVTWNGTSWTNTVGPDSSMDAIIEGVYSTSANGAFNAKTVTVNSGSLTVNSNTTIEIQDELVNNMAAANVIVESDGILRQINNATNVGQITVRRNSADMVRLDYTGWSSPVAGQNALAFSPQTVSTRFYEYNPTTNVYSGINPSTTDFTAGKGLLVRAPNNWSSTTPASYPGEFVGVPNNGTITTPVLTGFNLLGNPYSSPISATSFLINSNNDSTLGMTKLYFWTHTIASTETFPGSGVYVYTTSNYATHNGAGGVAADAGGEEPDGIIQVGQGFIVDVATNGNAEFTNTMRLSASNGQFFKNNNQTTSIERHRIWLDLTSPQYNHNQILIGYVSGATNGFDPVFDAELFGQTNSVLYSSINTSNSKFVIQSRALPFNPTDVVSVGFIAQVAGPYTISLNHVDGLFDSQDIYLKDNVLNVTHDIKAAPYTFTSTVGEFTNRFEIVYAQPLSVSNPQFNNDSVVVYNNDLGIHINSGSSMIDNIKVFDVRGRLLSSKTNINENVITLANDLASNQVLIIQVESTDNQIVTKKIVN